MSGQKIDQNHINLALKSDGEQKFQKYADMWVRYPSEPSEKQQEFVWRLLESERILRIQDQISEDEEKLDKIIEEKFQ